ncbi:NUDIX domain-containing protein [Meiothermus sp. CFH 77666]|uniref:NUDIX hydrolase n=1 Tax=Meiothermus sp. CFH 77666 TaxID=2817942 RepID=UPI001AA0AF76|nr:NUDIX domain-containing protein [Meiothermus sp. CFH 77666]MBO1435605.1 NUDIX domain-containing protein [Meiothermus sp. CFH 77666]
MDTKHPATRFNLRVGGVVMKHQQVLLCHEPQGDFWYLPGGRVELGEEARVAMAREIFEELGVKARVGRMLWVVENFFELSGCNSHEVGLYFVVDLPLHPTPDPLLGHEGEQDLWFRWIPLHELPQINLKPDFLKSALRALPVRTKHIVHRG